MRRSFKIAGLFAVLLANHSAPQARGFGAAVFARPVVAPRAPFTARPGMMPSRGIAAGGGRFAGRRRFGYGGYGFGDYGLGLATLDGGFGGGQGGPGSDAGAANMPPLYAIPAPRPCAPPLIIQVGRGLAHPVKTRVVYGAPTYCGP